MWDIQLKHLPPALYVNSPSNRPDYQCKTDRGPVVHECHVHSLRNQCVHCEAFNYTAVSEYLCATSKSESDVHWMPRSHLEPRYFLHCRHVLRNLSLQSSKEILESADGRWSLLQCYSDQYIRRNIQRLIRLHNFVAPSAHHLEASNALGKEGRCICDIPYWILVSS